MSIISLSGFEKQPIPVKILAIIVIYRQLPADTLSLQTLLVAAQCAAKSNVTLKIIVADNTPRKQVVALHSEQFQYRVYEHNPGLAQPYNDALYEAQSQNFDWLLTLDQDTALPENFLSEMARGVRCHGADSSVAAIVPRITDQNRTISPFYFLGGFLPVVRKSVSSGITPPHTSALNSASLFRVNNLVGLKGYDERFPLHNSDTRMYQRLDKAGKRVAVLGDVVVRHDLSILNYAKKLTPERYKRMLEDECIFWDLHMGTAGRIERSVRLLGRCCKGFWRGEDPAFLQITLGELRRRLLTSRNARLRAADALWAAHLAG